MLTTNDKWGKRKWQNRELVFGKWENGKLVGENMNKMQMTTQLATSHRVPNSLLHIQHPSPTSIMHEASVNLPPLTN